MREKCLVTICCFPEKYIPRNRLIEFVLCIEFSTFFTLSPFCQNSKRANVAFTEDKHFGTLVCI